MILKFVTEDKNYFFNLKNYEIDDIIYGSDEVKEIAISSNNKDGNLKLDKLYKMFKEVEPSDIKEVLIIYSNFQISYTFHVKEFYYRTFLYEKEREENIREVLSIRFVEDNIVIPNIENNEIYCNLECPYYDIDKCIKYRKKLLIQGDKILICRNCFLEMWPTIGREIYKKMTEV